MSKTWNGAFEKDTDKSVEEFTSSIDIDIRLYKHDIQGSIVHSQMLAKQEIITIDEASEIIRGLKEIENEIDTRNFKLSDSLEDVHMHIEARLIEKIGETAKKLHTARSRNDQVALDLRMYLKDEIIIILDLIKNLQKTLLEIAEKNSDVIMSGYTHLQKAQPILFSHHIMAYFEMFKRDGERMQDCFKRVNVMPLGSAALAGTTYPIDRSGVSELLGFKEISKNSMDAVSDRDFIMEFISNATISMIHLSRMSEEFILWSSKEFDFVEISDAFTTGSSIMPQKKNPDVAELVRGKTGRVVGSLMNIITIMKGLPLTYNRDMQEDKVPLFDTIDILKSSLDIYIKMLPNIKIKKENMAKSVQTGFLNATDFADYLTQKGIPFRDAHSIAGKTVAYAIKNKKELQDLSIDELQNFSNLIEKDIFESLKIENVINKRVSFGGTAKQNVLSAIKKAKKNIMRALHN